MRFDGMLQRAQEKGLKLLLIQLYPRPKLYATMPDKEFTKSFGTAIALAAKRFSENSKGKYSPEEVLQSMFADIKTHAGLALPRLEELSTEAGMIREQANEVARKLLDDGFMNDSFDKDDKDESDN